MSGSRVRLALLALPLLLLGSDITADTAVPQVLIESRIVVADNEFARQLGVEWGSKRLSPDACSEVALANDSALTGALGVVDLIEADPDLSSRPAGLNASAAMHLAAFQNQAIAEMISGPGVTKLPRGKQVAKRANLARNYGVLALNELWGREGRFPPGKRGQRSLGRFYDSVTSIAGFYEALGLPDLLEARVETFSGGTKRGIQSDTILELREEIRTKVKKGVLEVSGRGKGPVNGYAQMALNLQVTPTVNPDFTIFLDVRPKAKTDKQWAAMNGTSFAVEVDSDAGSPPQQFAFLAIQYGEMGAQQIYAADQGGVQGVWPLAAPNRNPITTVITKDGESLVLGALIRKDSGETEAWSTTVPALDQIPLLGWGFTNGGRKQKFQADNLLIFLTPHIISEP